MMMYAVLFISPSASLQLQAQSMRCRASCDDHPAMIASGIDDAHATV
jgi:hypothetical protein